MKISLLLLAALLGGCAGSTRNTSAIAVYDFGLASSIEKAELPANVNGKVALDVKTVPWLDAPIDYRLVYDDPFKRHQYANSRWAGAPAAMLDQRLRQQLGMAGAGSAAGCLLRIDIQEFAQVFDSPQSSHGVLHGRASLIDGKRRVIADRAISIEKIADTPDASGGARALIQSTRELGHELAAWLGQLDRKNDLAKCGAGQ